MTWEERQEKRLVWRDIRPWMGLMRCGRCGKWHAADLRLGEMFEACADLVAMKVESNRRSERAILAESTTFLERATIPESTMMDERATHGESQASGEHHANGASQAGREHQET